MAIAANFCDDQIEDAVNLTMAQVEEEAISKEIKELRENISKGKKAILATELQGMT